MKLLKYLILSVTLIIRSTEVLNPSTLIIMKVRGLNTSTSYNEVTEVFNTLSNLLIMKVKYLILNFIIR